jgi:hypothetical protein
LVPTLPRGSGLLSVRTTRELPQSQFQDEGFQLTSCSDNGDAWSHFTYDMARSRAFRWGEDGIAGVSDTHGRMNIAFSFWNEKE